MASVLINHPAFGSLWLDNAEIENGYVVGEAWDDSDVGSAYLPDDYQGEAVCMNFPAACIRKDPDGIATEQRSCRHAISNYQLDGDTGHVWCFACKPPRRITEEVGNESHN